MKCSGAAEFLHGEFSAFRFTHGSLSTPKLERMTILMTSTLAEEFAKIGHQAEILNPIIVARYYNRSGPGEWYPIEFNIETGEFFGYVIGFTEHSWKTFTLDDLKTLNERNENKIQLDLNFIKIRFMDMPEY